MVAETLETPVAEETELIDGKKVPRNRVLAARTISREYLRSLSLTGVQVPPEMEYVITLEIISRWDTFRSIFDALLREKRFSV